MTAPRKRKPPGARRRVLVPGILLSFSEADGALRAQNGTTSALVASGRLRPIPWGRRFRVLASDLERVASEGILPDLRKPRAPRRKATAAGVGDRIRAIQIPGVNP
jgi:hypothetical protein